MIRQLLTCIMLCLSVVSFAQTTARPYNVEEFKQACKEYEEYENQEGVTVQELIHAAKSMKAIGVKLKNYRIEFYALSALSEKYFIDNNLEASLECIRESQKLAKENNDEYLYFRSKYNECDFITTANSSEGMLKAHDLINEAAKERSIIGQVYGHRLLGVINLYYRYEYGYAAAEFKKAINLAQDSKSMSGDHVKLSTLYASALVELHQYDEANKVLKDLLNGDRPLTDNEVSGINVIFMDMAYNQKVSAQVYDSIYKSNTETNQYEFAFPEDTRLFYKIRWLIRTGQTDEALKLIPKLEHQEDRLHLRQDVFIAKGNYEAAFAFGDSIRIIEDSLSMCLRDMDLDAIEQQIHEVEMQDEARLLQTERQELMLVAIVLTLGMGLAFTTYTLVRRRRTVKLMTQTNKMLQKMNAQLTEANMAKTHFIQNMTHELHTPLNAINGFATLLSAPGMEFSKEEMNEMTSAINAGCMSLTDTIDNIILISEYDDTDYIPTFAPCTPTAIVKNAMLSVNKPNTELVRMVEELNVAEDFVLNTSESLVEKVLKNLINNSVKFTHEGYITVGTKLEDNGKSFLFFVTDTGVGIPEGKEEEVFERFTKIDEFVPGTGLGLSLCRVIANKLGGTIFIDRTYKEQGTRMVLKLPVQ